VAAAQEALREDPQNESARKLLANAESGQQALVQLRGAQAALAKDDFAGAETQLEAARRLAPWDRGVVDFGSRIAEAKGRAQREAEAKAQSARAEQIDELLKQATNSAQARQYEAAIAAFDRVLELDRGNQVAAIGKSNAITARDIAESAASGPRAVLALRSFVAGRTQATAPEPGGLVGFEDSAGVTPKKGTTAAQLPGNIVFEASPSSPRAGDHFKVSVFLSNEGAQPIQLASMTVTTTVDGRPPQRGQPPLPVSTVAPGQRAPILQTPGDQVWKESTQAWVMEIVLRTTKGETYRNTLTWK
jgi:tetratricopeptide (TPR) repeat protein